MGTRADFYVGRGEQAEWLGSVAWDGYPDGILPRSTEVATIGGETFMRSGAWPKGGHLFDATTVDEFKARLETYFAGRDDVTRPEMGWPWPWETSALTDCVYAFDEGCVWTSRFGREWRKVSDDEPDGNLPAAEFDRLWPKGGPGMYPNMASRKNVAHGQRSGLLVLTR